MVQSLNFKILNMVDVVAEMKDKGMGYMRWDRMGGARIDRVWCDREVRARLVDVGLMVVGSDHMAVWVG